MIRARVAAVGFCLLAGCQVHPSASSGASTPSGSVRVAPSAQSSPAITSPGTSPSPDLPLSKVSFSCRLPVVTKGTDIPEIRGGFLTFPDATLHPDPAGGLRYTSQGEMVTDGKPALRGNGEPPFYDLAMKRWVPVTPAQTSPDGAFYAYSTDQTQIHIVNVARGSDRIFPLTVTPQFSQQIWIEDFDGRGVDFVFAGPSGDQLGGLWRLDVSSGSVKTVAQLKLVDAVRAGYAWVAADDPRDTSPPLFDYLFDSLVRVDLATGAQTLWYYAPGKGVSLRGFDGSGEPVIYVYSAPDFNHADIRIATGPLEAGTEVYNGPMSLYRPQRDGERLWFSNDQGIYLFTAAAGLQKVFAFSPDPPFAESIQPVGFCL